MLWMLWAGEHCRHLSCYAVQNWLVRVGHGWPSEMISLRRIGTICATKSWPLRTLTLVAFGRWFTSHLRCLPGALKELQRHVRPCNFHSVCSMGNLGVGLEPVCGFACLSAPFMFWGSTACRSAAFRHLMVNCIPLLVIQTRSNNTCAQCVRMSVLTLPSEEKGVGKAQMEDRHGLQLQKRTLTLLTLWPLTPRRALMRSYGASLMNSQWSPWTDLSQILKVRCVARCALWPAWGPNDRPSWDPCWSSRCFSVLMRPPCQTANMTCLEISCHQRCHMVSCSVHFLWSMYVNDCQCAKFIPGGLLWRENMWELKWIESHPKHFPVSGSCGSFGLPKVPAVKRRWCHSLGFSMVIQVPHSGALQFAQSRRSLHFDFWRTFYLLHPFTSFYLIPFLTDSLQNSLRDWFWSSMCWLRGIVQWLCGHKSGSNCVRHRLWFATCRTQRLAAPRGTRKNTTFQIFQFATHLQWGLLLRSFKYFWRINIHRLSQTLAHQLN